VFYQSLECYSPVPGARAGQAAQRA